MSVKRVIKIALLAVFILIIVVGTVRFLKKNDIDDLYGPYPDSDHLKDPVIFDTDAPKPNIIIVYLDDLGYGDLGCFGSQAINTPNLDKMAEEGVKFTNYYSVAAICAPSRAGLLTGRYPFRTGVIGNPYPADAPLSYRAQLKAAETLSELGAIDLHEEYVAEGLSQKEITIADALQIAGYKTGMIGKWHLGDYSREPYYNPINHGFNYYFGVPHSNDMHPFPLYKNEEELFHDLVGEEQAILTKLFTDEAIAFIEASKEEPFFLYLAHVFPHQPLYASEEFQRTSKAGLYGDVVEEIDWNMGRIFNYLEKNNLEENTLIFFTSDNGPWYEGSSGGFRGRKGEVYSGGYRVPFIAKYPGEIPAGLVIDTTIISLDLFPTILSLAGIELPSDRTIDGKNIIDNLTGDSTESPHEAIYFYHYNEIQAVLSGDFKYIRRMNRYTWPIPLTTAYIPMEVFKAKDPLGDIFPLLYDMNLDPNESYNVIKKYPDVADELSELMEKWEASVEKNPRGFFVFDY